MLGEEEEERKVREGVDLIIEMRTWSRSPSAVQLMASLSELLLFSVAAGYRCIQVDQHVLSNKLPVGITAHQLQSIAKPQTPPQDDLMACSCTYTLALTFCGQQPN